MDRLKRVNTMEEHIICLPLEKRKEELVVWTIGDRVNNLMIMIMILWELLLKDPN